MRAEEAFKRLQSNSPWNDVLVGTLFCMGVCSAEVGSARFYEGRT